MTPLDQHLDNAPSPATAAPRPATAEPRLGVLSADRPCARCGFNLHGATIIREPHYQLVSARCPECGQLAALQEYPSLSPWTGRARLLLAAQFVAGALAAILVTGLIMWGVSEGVSQDVCAPYAQALDVALAKLQSDTFPNTGVAQRYQYLTPKQISDWWKNLPPEKFLADQGGLRGALNWWGLLDFGFIFPLFFAIGVFWSILFARVRAWRLIVLMLVPAALGGTFYYAEFISSSQRYLYFNSGHIFAAMQVGWMVVIISFVFCLLTLWLAVLVGRPIARWFIATLLPPRLVTAFSFLWFADNKPLPRPS